MPCITMPPRPESMPPPPPPPIIGGAAAAGAMAGGGAPAGRPAGGGGTAPARDWVDAGIDGRAGGGACLATGLAAPVRREGGMIFLLSSMSGSTAAPAKKGGPNM